MPIPRSWVGYKTYVTHGELTGEYVLKCEFWWVKFKIHKAAREQLTLGLTDPDVNFVGGNGSCANWMEQP
uniref:Uncharacterized protein n=2 Tax=Oreochromis TaxID=8139 RepID=A0A669B316_ORENI